ncbi:MAG TPA: hypothetical protein DDW90_03205 [Cyanobacteria bacterium UBA9971]|nr:hypothetical protein [Cyanobacteria bacterium UBA9971]
MQNKNSLKKKAEAIAQRLFENPTTASSDLCVLLELVNIYIKEEADRIIVKVPEQYQDLEKQIESLKNLQNNPVINLKKFKKESKKYWKIILNKTKLSICPTKP